MKALPTTRNVFRREVCLCSRRRLLSACLAVANFCALGALGRVPSAAQGAGEYQVKATFIQNFARFVDWPADTATDGRPFAICVLGRDPFEGELDQAIKGRTVNSRGFAIKQTTGIQGAKSCQIVFVSASERKHFEAILDGLNHAGVLTVGDSDGFIQSGGIINFVLEDGKVRCEINAGAAARAHLKVSSKLLGVSRIVDVRGRQ
jgi:YfiR/HmsC-like